MTERKEYVTEKDARRDTYKRKHKNKSNKGASRGARNTGTNRAGRKDVYNGVDARQYRKRSKVSLRSANNIWSAYSLDGDESEEKSPIYDDLS